MNHLPGIYELGWRRLKNTHTLTYIREQKKNKTIYEISTYYASPN